MKFIIVLLTLIVIALPITGKLAEASCYNETPTGKNILNEQTIDGVDCFTGKFNTLKPIRAVEERILETSFDFDTFRFIFLTMILFVGLSVIAILFKKKIVAAILASLGFFTGIAAVLYFDSFHNYYPESVHDGLQTTSFTFDVQFGRLNHPVFWLLFVLLLAFHWIPLFYKLIMKSKRNSKQELIDN